MLCTLALGDLHLTRSSPASVVADVARFFRENRGARVLFTGDVLDLSADAEAAVDMHPAVAKALAAHLEDDGEVFWVAGNHDARVAAPEFSAKVAAALGLSAAASARFHVSPWFFRLGGVHLEHGHRFDPDNAPAHPLVPDGPSLGVCFVEELIVPTGAFAFLNANDGTPLDLFVNAFRWYGPRAPYVVAKFFTTAATALRRSGSGFDAQSQILEGSARQNAFASSHGVDENTLESLRGAGAVPTLASRRDTFSRLYLDRVAATLAILGGGVAYGFGAKRSGAAAALLGGLLMGASWSRGHDRYGGAVAERLARGAEAIARLTGDPLVVFGHSHRAEEGRLYANPGSFAFAKGLPGRPFLEIEGADSPRPRAVLRHFV